MPKLLSENDVAAYRDRGYHFPVDALSAGEVLQRNLFVYGLGGLVVPFIGIKAIDLVVYNLLHLV